MGLSGAGLAPGEPGEGQRVVPPGCLHWGHWCGAVPGTAQGTAAGFSILVIFGFCPCKPGSLRAGGCCTHHAGMALQGAVAQIGIFLPCAPSPPGRAPKPTHGQHLLSFCRRRGLPRLGDAGQGTSPRRRALAVLWGLRGVLCLLPPGSMAHGERKMLFSEAHGRRSLGIRDACTVRMS